MLMDDEEDELEQDESPAKPAPRPGSASGRRALVQDSSDDEMADAQPPPVTVTAAGECCWCPGSCCLLVSAPAAFLFAWGTRPFSGQCLTC